MKKVVLYIRKTNVIGGIETFIFNFCYLMSSFCDITVMAGEMADIQAERLKPLAKVLRGNDINVDIECDTLIMLRILDKIPPNVHYDKVIRRIHTMKSPGVSDIPHDGDITVSISEAVRKDFNLTGPVINNLMVKTSKPTLFLISATRLPAPDKGDNEARMRKLADMLNEAEISFLWLNFSDGQMKDPPKGFYNMPLTLDIQDYIQKADYLVQLSSREAFGNSVLEALINNTAVICTPIPAFKEFGVEDGINAHVVPFDMNFNVKGLLNIPKFEYEYDNGERIVQWLSIL